MLKIKSASKTHCNLFFFIFKENDELTQILKFLAQRDAFIIEIEYLKKLQNPKFLELTKVIRFNTDYFMKSDSSFSSNGLLSLNFGVFNENLDNFDNNVSQIQLLDSVLIQFSSL